jgi:hypothetical protein
MTDGPPETKAERLRRQAAVRMKRWRDRHRTGRRTADINPKIADELPDAADAFNEAVNRLLTLGLTVERNGSVTSPRPKAR